MTDQAAQTDPAVVARIRKLMNLSKDGAASENEQEIAASHAQRLMLEHNVSVAMVEASHDTSSVVRRKKEAHAGNAMYAWQQELMARIATTSFVTVMSNVSRNQWDQRVKGYLLVGREENVVGCQTMFDYLRLTIERLAREYAGAGRQFSNEASSFKKGCAERVGERLLTRHRKALAEQRAAAEAQKSASGGTALTVIMEDFAEAEACANEDFRLGLAAGTTAHKKFVTARLSDAYMAVSNELEKVAYNDIDDRVMLEQKADELVLEAIAACGLDPEEMKRVVNYGRYAVSQHITLVKERRNPPKRRRSSGRSWRYTAPRDNTNYGAYNDGSKAGDAVGLDKQAAHSPLKQVR